MVDGMIAVDSSMQMGRRDRYLVPKVGETVNLSRGKQGKVRCPSPGQ